MLGGLGIKPRKKSRELFAKQARAIKAKKSGGNIRLFSTTQCHTTDDDDSRIDDDSLEGHTTQGGVGGGVGSNEYSSNRTSTQLPGAMGGCSSCGDGDRVVSRGG